MIRNLIVLAALFVASVVFAGEAFAGEKLPIPANNSGNTSYGMVGLKMAKYEDTDGDGSIDKISIDMDGDGDYGDGPYDPFERDQVLYWDENTNTYCTSPWYASEVRVKVTNVVEHGEWIGGEWYTWVTWDGSHGPWTGAPPVTGSEWQMEA